MQKSDKWTRRDDKTIRYSLFTNWTENNQLEAVEYEYLQIPQVQEAKS